jgi:predicted N-acetyltransferase YhbS
MLEGRPEIRHLIHRRSRSMKISSGYQGQEAELVEMFRASFADSEGEEEGALIAQLVRRLLEMPADDLFVFTAQANGKLLGGIVFSRLHYELDKRTVFVLGPLAVAPAHQREGVGRKLITVGLETLRRSGVDIAMTYGDPAYYARVGFRPISETEAPAPFPLQHPDGWLAQSLTGQAIGTFSGRSRCVEAFNDPVFW